MLGYIVRGPLGGLVWHHFQYAYGLHLMGHDVLFVEDSEEYAACYNPATFQMTADPTYGLTFIRSVFSRYHLDNNWAYFDFHSNQWYGRSLKDVLAFLTTADVLLNISGINPLREWVKNIPKKVFIDTDPVFTQIRHLKDKNAWHLAAEHDVFLTYGENYGKPGCSIPNDGFLWKPTRQPVVMDLWKAGNRLSNSRWTTVIQWDSYKTAEWEGRSFGMKSQSFAPYIDLPKRLDEVFELALGSDSAPKDELKKSGWLIVDPLFITRTPESYQQYIMQSKGEWSVAKHAYVMTKSGWFSERSAVYLASGKPVVVQDTGFSRNMNTGEGLLKFDSPEDLTEIFENINENYDFHCKRAAEVCKDYFDHYSVLSGLIQDL